MNSNSTSRTQFGRKVLSLARSKSLTMQRERKIDELQAERTTRQHVRS